MENHFDEKELSNYPNRGNMNETANNILINQHSPGINRKNANNQNINVDNDNDDSEKCCNFYSSNPSNRPNTVNNKNVNNVNNESIQSNNNGRFVTRDQYNNLLNQNKDLQNNLSLNKNVINNQANFNQKYQEEINNLKNILKDKDKKINLLEIDNQKLKKDLEDKNKKLNELQKLLDEESNKTNLFIKENENLRNIINVLDKKKSIENNVASHNIASQNNYLCCENKPQDSILAVTFFSSGRNDIDNYSLICKKTELFVRLEERLYQDFPQFKDYEMNFLVAGIRIKRFKTIEENNIKNNDKIMCVVDD